MSLPDWPCITWPYAQPVPAGALLVHKYAQLGDFSVQSQNWVHWWTGLLDTHYLLISIFTFRIFFTAWSIVLDDPDEVHRSKHVRNTAVLYTTNITADETSLVVKKLPIATLKIRLIQQFTLIQNSLSSKMRLDGNMVLLQ